ncbi:ABC transporter permease [Paenibacillus sp. CAU 1782]
MRIFDLLKMSWGQIIRRKIVTLLCMIGLSVGCAAIIMAISISTSAQNFSQQQLNSEYKMDEITVQPNSIGGGGQNPSQTGKSFDRGALTLQKLDVIKRLAHVKAVFPTMRLGNVEMIGTDGKVSNVEVIGTDLSALSEFGFKYAQGGASALLGTGIANYGASFGMVDAQVMKDLYEKLNQDPYNDEIYLQFDELSREPAELFQRQVNFRTGNVATGANSSTYKVSTPLRISGQLQVKDGASQEYSIYEKTIYVSMETASMLRSQLGLGQSESLVKYDSVTVRVEDKKYTPQVEEQVKKLFLTTQSNLYQEEMIQQKFAQYRKIALGIGTFILMLASLSIFVAMTMSTHQRRRQIGVMKILGANLWQIRQLFMTEAAVLGLMGGATGLLVSTLILWGANNAIAKGLLNIGPQSIEIPPLALLAGVIFALITGIVSGIYPAISASRTNALEVIKNG